MNEINSAWLTNTSSSIERKGFGLQKMQTKPKIILPPVATTSHDQKMGIHWRIRRSAPRKQSWSRSQSWSRRIGKVDEIGRRLAVRRRNPRQETQIKSNLISTQGSLPWLYGSQASQTPSPSLACAQAPDQTRLNSYSDSNKIRDQSRLKKDLSRS